MKFPTADSTLRTTKQLTTYLQLYRGYCVSICAFAILFIVTTGFAGDTPTPAPSAPKARTTPDNRASLKDTATEVLERQADKLADRIDAGDDQLAKANDYKHRVDDAKGKLGTLSLQTSDRVKDVSDAFNRLKTAKPEEDVSSKPVTAGFTFVNAFGQLRSSIITPMTEIVGTVIPSVKYSFTFGGPAHVNTPLEQIVDEAAATVPDLKQGDPFYKNTAKLNALATALYRPGGVGVAAEVKRNTMEAQISDAQSEINSLGENVTSAANEYRTGYDKMLTNVSQALQRELDRLQAAQESDRQHLADINKELVTRSQGVGSRQTTLTDKLIYTELLMIGILAFAVYFLKRYPERIALTIVQERTLGDMLGMGLLLVTIVFLATGDFIDKAAVVTLLGTIAGYIFGRRAPGTPAATTAPPATPAATTASPARLAAPSNLKEVTPPKPGQITVSCDLVSTATMYRWFAKLESSAGDLVFRQGTAQPRTVLTGFNTGDKVVIAVSAMDGQESPRSAPITVTVT